MKRQIPTAVLIFALTALPSALCAQEEAAASVDPAVAAIEAMLPRASRISGEALGSKGVALRFYKVRGFAPAWGERRDRKALIKAIEGSKAHGLEPGRYHLEAIERLKEGGDSADLDILMTDAFLTLAGHLDAGILNPYHSGANQRKPRSDTDLAAVLAGALGGHDVRGVLERLAPQSDDYRRMRRALVKVREIAATVDWPKVPKGSKRKIEPGDTDASIPAVRARLAAEGFIESPNQSKVRTRKQINDEMADTPSEPADDFYSEDLVEGVMRFQERYGLGPDGVIGHRTLTMMNRDPAWRVCQIKVGLDRLRALKHVITTERYAIVNVPDFMLTIYENGKPINSMKVIVGMYNRQSPLMSDRIRFIVFSPKWHVPTSIAVKDKLPKIKKDPSFIRKHGMKVYAVGETGMEEVEPEAVDWESLTLDNFPYRIVQRSGDANALGRIKFMFPNRHDVYLHDTPTKYLFDRGQRTYSSGCIRISDPTWFAEYLLKGMDGWDRERMQASMRRGTPLFVNLDEHMPIHILYRTAWADEDGTPIFRYDVYGYDRAAAKKLCDG